jgi:pimeloyl-ACP methyl ester carboxylesterase
MPVERTEGPSPFRSDEARERYLGHCATMEESWPITSEARTVDTEYGTTFMRLSGADDRPPLVLLPGATTNSLCWTNVIEALSARFRTYAIDAIYDAGRSVPSRPLKEVDDLTGWLDGLLDELGLPDGVDMMGLSYGAYAVGEYLLHAPQRLRKVVWLSPAMTVAPISRGFLLHLAPTMVPLRPAYRRFAGWVMPYMKASDERMFEELVDELWLARRCYGPMSLPGGRVFSDDELAAIDVPVLYLCGDRDGVCEDAREVVAHLGRVAPRIQASLIADAGHDAVAMRPQEVSERALAFLEA